MRSKLIQEIVDAYLERHSPEEIAESMNTNQFLRLVGMLPEAETKEEPTNVLQLFQSWENE